jgi:hypothetical protein
VEIHVSLRALAGREAGCRRVLGRLARRFLLRSAHQRLGFARIDDYARERLGISGRELQELARVERALEALPLVASAFAAGELSWSHVRVLASVAAPDTEREWLLRARGATVRGLAAMARRAEPDDDALDGEETSWVSIGCPRHVRRAWIEAVELASRMEGVRIPAWRAAEAMAAEGLASEHGTTIDAPCARSTCPPPSLPETARWTPGSETLPEDVERLAAPWVVDPHRLDAHLQMALATLQSIDWEMGRLLAVLSARRLHQQLGIARFADYVRERLGMSLRRARALMAIDRAASCYPELGEAYRAGRLSMARALVILPVLHEATVGAWIARAQEVTIRRLSDLIAAALEADEGRGPIMPGPAEEVFDSASAACADPAVAARVLVCDADTPPGNGAGPSAVQMCAHRLDAEVRFRAPQSVAALFRGAVRAYTQPGEPPWRGLERLLCHARAEWLAQPRHRDPIFERDGWRCAVPACGARASLHDHHIVYRSRGGDNAWMNRVTICATHHLRGIHGMRIRVDGLAPHDLTWELGLRRPHPPLMRTHGDRYLEPYTAALETLGSKRSNALPLAS